jgi:hypothetical protein
VQSRARNRYPRHKLALRTRRSSWAHSNRPASTAPAADADSPMPERFGPAPQDLHLDNSTCFECKNSHIDVQARRGRKDTGLRVRAIAETGFSRLRPGEGLFASSGCVGCHPPTMRTGEKTDIPQLARQPLHPYTDLLLHDMGEGPADGRPGFRGLGQGMARVARWRQSCGTVARLRPPGLPLSPWTSPTAPPWWLF